MNGPVVLIFNLNGSGFEEIQRLSEKLGIRVRKVLPEEYGAPLALLAGLQNASEAAAKVAGFQDEMLVFVGFKPEQLDEYLQSFRSGKIPPVALKAVLTPTNALWNSLQLRDELCRENQEMMKNRQKQP